MEKWLNDFKRLDLFQDKEQQERDFEILNKVFTSNQYDWIPNLFTLDGIYTNEEFIEEPLDKYEIPRRLRDGKIKIYKYTLKRPQEPTGEELRSMRKLGSFFSERTGLLYWWIKKFTEHQGINVKRGYNSYLKLYDENGNEIFAKCGELMGSTLCEYMRYRDKSCNKLIIVPFIDRETYLTVKEIDIYMLEYEEEYLQDFNRRVNKRSYEAIAKLQRDFGKVLERL